MRLTYELLFKYGFKQLIKKGFTEEQILKKVSKYYLKEQRQLIINPEKGLTLSRAIKNIKRGKIDQGVWIQKTALSNLKADIKNLEKLDKIVQKLQKQDENLQNYAKNLLEKYNKGQINIYELHNAVYSYTGNINEYINKKLQTDNLNLITDFYNPDINKNAHAYTNAEIRSFYE